MLRVFALIALAAWLCLAGAVRADGESDAQSPAADTETTTIPEEQPAVGPLLQPSDYAPVLCDPGHAGFRYVEIRGSGFDAWTSQHLVGNLADASARRGLHGVGQSRLWRRHRQRGHLDHAASIARQPVARVTRAATDRHPAASKAYRRSTAHDNGA